MRTRLRVLLAVPTALIALGLVVPHVSAATTQSQKSQAQAQKSQAQAQKSQAQAQKSLAQAPQRYRECYPITSDYKHNKYYYYKYCWVFRWKGKDKKDKDYYRYELYYWYMKNYEERDYSCWWDDKNADKDQPDRWKDWCDNEHS